MSRLFRCCISVSVVSLFALSVSAQQVFFKYSYKFEPATITSAPQLGRLEVTLPEMVRKNGVDGIVKVSGTLGEDGKVRDIAVINDPGHGTGAAVAAGLQRLSFTPAFNVGKPAPMKFTVEYLISRFYDENDKNVTKPTIIDKPPPHYPPSKLAAAIEGRVSLRILFMASGEVRVAGVSTLMEPDFDKAAQEAAKKIKFSPAIHKKTKQPVAQEMTVDYDFKP